MKINILSALWLLMAWCFSTRTSVATVLNTHPYLCSCLWINQGHDTSLILNDNISYCIAWSENIRIMYTCTKYGGWYYINCSWRKDIMFHSCLLWLFRGRLGVTISLLIQQSKCAIKIKISCCNIITANMTHVRQKKYGGWIFFWGGRIIENMEKIHDLWWMYFTTHVHSFWSKLKSLNFSLLS